MSYNTIIQTIMIITLLYPKFYLLFNYIHRLIIKNFTDIWALSDYIIQGIGMLFGIWIFMAFQMATPIFFFHHKIIFTMKNHKQHQKTNFSCRKDDMKQKLKRPFCALYVLKEQIDEHCHLLLFHVSVVSRVTWKHIN